MTSKARKRTMNPGLMKIGVWNVRGLYGEEKLLQEEFYVITTRNLCSDLSNLEPAAYVSIVTRLVREPERLGGGNFLLCRDEVILHGVRTQRTVILIEMLFFSQIELNSELLNSSYIDCMNQYLLRGT